MHQRYSFIIAGIVYKIKLQNDAACAIIKKMGIGGEKGLGDE
jgi:hypothetical protein